MEEIVKVENVKKEYKLGNTSIFALKGIDLILHPGFYLIMGPSGSGKSTFLNLIGALDKPTEGNVYVNGNLLNDMPDKKITDLRRNKIGFVFQAYSLLPVLNVHDNIEYPIIKNVKSKEERDFRIENILREVGLEGYEKRYPRELSGGQQQRVAIARALVSNPKLIIADEPTANLDSKTGELILDLFKTMQDKHGMSIILSSHDEYVIERVEKHIVLRDGLIVGGTK